MRIKENDYIVEQDFDVVSLDYSKAEAHIEKMRDLEFAIKECILIFDYHKHNYFYIKSYNQYFSKIPKQIKRPYVLFNSQIHPDDVEFVKQIHHRAFQYIFTLNIDKRKDLRLCYRCQMTTNDNNYKMANITTKLLETDSKGNIWLVMILIQQAPTQSYIVPYIEMPFIKDKYAYNFNKSYQLFNSAEREIIDLIFKDATNSEIAKIINKSESTTNKQLSRIYSKIETNKKTEFQKALLNIFDFANFKTHYLN